jgi:hypothetical protein
MSVALKIHINSNQSKRISRVLQSKDLSAALFSKNSLSVLMEQFSDQKVSSGERS